MKMFLCDPALRSRKPEPRRLPRLRHTKLQDESSSAIFSPVISGAMIYSRAQQLPKSSRNPRLAGRRRCSAPQTTEGNDRESERETRRGAGRERERGGRESETAASESSWAAEPAPAAVTGRACCVSAAVGSRRWLTGSSAAGGALGGGPVCRP